MIKPAKRKIGEKYKLYVMNLSEGRVYIVFKQVIKKQLSHV